MRTLLASTAILAATVGIASAEVAVTGTARMGLIDTFGDTGVQFSSRVRINFTASGQTDTGLSFGASMRADQFGGNSNDGSNGSSGNTGDTNGDSTVYISGGFGKLTMGDVDGAANAASGQTDGVGYTGLSDLNEITYLANGGTDFNGPGIGLDDPQDTSVLYEYTAGSLSFYLSSTQLDRAIGAEAKSIAAKYSTGAYAVSLGYENLDAQDDYEWEQFVLGGSATFGGVTLKAIYADGKNNQGDEWKQHSLSATYAVDALSLTAFVSDDEDLLSNDLATASNVRAYGLGASYDLGGGAKVSGGYVKNRTDDTDAVDLGLSFSF
ncbi:porin [Tabrizicola sp.]|uniref:porin n=1 Tax=Tabrizicola sp. TaxID=2005166 RepID=UPI0035AF9B65